MPQDNRVRYNARVNEYLEPLENAFTNSITNFTNDINYPALVTAIRASDTDKINELTRMPKDSFEEVTAILSTAFIAGGVLALLSIPTDQKMPSGAPANRVFTGMKTSELSTVSKQATALVASVSPSSTRGVKATIREGKREGKPATRIARELVGVRNPTTGVRQGGTVGLSAGQSKTVRTVTDGFINGDKGRIRSYFTLKNRDSSLDKRIRAALDTGDGKVGMDLITEIRNSLQSNYLFARGKAVADLEVRNAVDAGRDAGYDNIMEQGIVENAPTKAWRAFRDSQTRDSHRDIDGTEIPLDEDFTLNTGAVLSQPRDTSLGAGPADVINCRCYLERLLTFKNNG